MFKVRALLLIAAGLCCMAAPQAQPQRGIVAPDTGGMSYGLKGVNAANRAQAGTMKALPSIQADGARGVNRVNMRQGGIKVRPKSLHADTPRMGISKTDIIRY